MEKKLIAVIEKATDGGFSIYAKDVDGAFGYGLTEEEARQDFVEVLEEQADYYKERHGEFPQWYSEGMEVEYQYDLSGFFEAFPFISVSGFAEAVGINASLMRRYKSGSAFAGEKQRKAIQAGYDRIIHRMQAVRF